MKQTLQSLSGAFVAVLLGISAANAQYCIPTYDANCGSGDNINTFNLVNSGINHLNSGCSPAGYGDYTTDPSLLGSLEAEVSYNFSITHDYQSSQFVKIYIDFNSDETFDEVTELLFTSPSGSVDGLTEGTITIPAMAPVNGLRMRVTNSYNTLPSTCGYSSYYGETHDYTVNILPVPTCLVPNSPSLDNVGAFTADISWGLIGNGIGYNIEWGLPGFTPGTGAELGSESGYVGSTYEITGLTPSTDHEFYIQTDCDVTDGLSQWAGPISFTTLCVPITALPWEENFDAMPAIDYDLFPNCWEREGYGWGTADDNYYFGDANALSPSNFLSMQWGSNGYVFTPTFELVGGETYEFIFNWAGEGHSGWNGEVVVSQTQSSADAVVIGDPFVVNGEATTLDYKREKYCFTPDVDGVYSFGFYVTETQYWYSMSIDDISVRQAASSVGTDADITVCEQSGMVNLDDLATITDFEGNWTFSSNPSALVNENELNVDVIPNTTVMATYLSNSCLADDVTATITVVQSVSAGEDGIMNNICMSQPIDLLGGLGGAFNLGGQWYNPSNQPIASSYINTGNLPGQQNYYYIVGNGGICPDDTSNVIVNVGTCNYLSIEDISASDFNVFPNPATSNVTVSGSFNANTVDYILIDLNGKQVLNATNVDATNNEIQIDLVNLTEGVYILKLNSSTEENYFRIVKQ